MKLFLKSSILNFEIHFRNRRIAACGRNGFSVRSRLPPSLISLGLGLKTDVDFLRLECEPKPASSFQGGIREYSDTRF